MPIRITSAANETIEDAIPNAKGGDGAKQFGGVSLASTFGCRGVSNMEEACLED